MTTHDLELYKKGISEGRRVALDDLELMLDQHCEREGNSAGVDILRILIAQAR